MYSVTFSVLIPFLGLALALPQAPVSGNGLRYCSGTPDAWGDGAPTCVSGVSSISAEYNTVTDGFNNQYCNGDW